MPTAPTPVALHAVDLDGQSQCLVHAGPGTAVYHPQLSPDGRWLVCDTKRGGVRQWRVLRLTDRTKRLITRHTAGTAAMRPHWRPVNGSGE